MAVTSTLHAEGRVGELECTLADQVHLVDRVMIDRRGSGCRRSCRREVKRFDIFSQTACLDFCDLGARIPNNSMGVASPFLLQPPKRLSWLCDSRLDSAYLIFFHRDDCQSLDHNLFIWIT